MNSQAKTNSGWSVQDVIAKCGEQGYIIAEVCVSAISQKKVSRPDGLVETVVKLFDYFNYFNTLTVDDTVVVMESIKSLDDVQIPREFADFITPVSVKVIAGNRRLPEMLKLRPATKYIVQQYSYYEYINLVDQFRSYFKKDGSADCVSLSSLKKELALMDVLSSASVVGKVNYDSDPYYPIELNDWFGQVIGNRFLQDDADLMIKDYCAKLRF